MVSKRYRRIIATRSVQGLDEEIGFLPGTEAEKMEPWLGAITDNPKPCTWMTRVPTVASSTSSSGSRCSSSR